MVLTHLEPVYTAATSAVMTILVCIDVVSGPTAMARWHHDLAVEFSALEQALTALSAPSDTALRQLEQEGLKILIFPGNSGEPAYGVMKVLIFQSMIVYLALIMTRENRSSRLPLSG